MNQFQKAKVIMLPTEKASNIYKDGYGKLHLFPIIDSLNSCKQHLYITSDEEIKEGDWYIAGDKIEKCGSKEESNDLTDKCKKIIATTDESLGLPRPSDSFIKKYCELGGIEDVLVEYEEKTIDEIEIELDIHGHDIGLTTYEYDEYIKTNSAYKLKVAPDNTITIKPIKSSWNREEVEHIINLFDSLVLSKLNFNIAGSFKQKFIQENL